MQEWNNTGHANLTVNIDSLHMLSNNGKERSFWFEDLLQDLLVYIKLPAFPQDILE